MDVKLKLSGASILVQSLKEQGVDTIFGYPGGQAIHIYDALYDSDIKHILTRHEQAAVHAAEGYARATGKVGVCLVTSGPGATNLVTGIANAYMDSVPLVAITGQVPTGMLGKDSFQEVDITGITLPITKHNYLVKDVNDLARIVKEAFYIANTGRKGPVLVDLPSDVSKALGEYNPNVEMNLPGYTSGRIASEDSLNNAAKLIMDSKRPMIYCGGGVISSNASPELLQLAQLLVAPVACSLIGMGGFPGDHPLFVGMLGMHGSKYGNFAVCETDLLIVLGARFSERVTGKVDNFAPDAKIIHVDIDPAELNKNVQATIPLCGDVKIVLQKLLERLNAKLPGAWQEKIATWKKEYPLFDENMSLGQRVKPQEAIRDLYKVTNGDAIITTEVGQHQMWAAHHYIYKRPRTFISSGGLGTMGYGFPASIGAQVGCPDDLVFNIAGDGSIQMNIQELATAVNYELPVNTIILNNGYLGMVRQWQDLFYDRRYSQTEITGPDFVKVAEAYGAKGIRVEKSSELIPAFEQAKASLEPVFLDVLVEREENVFPMVPPGASLKDML